VVLISLFRKKTYYTRHSCHIREILDRSCVVLSRVFQRTSVTNSLRTFCQELCLNRSRSFFF